MKKLKLIYNPYSGNKSFKFDLDICIKIFQSGGYDVHIFRSGEAEDIKRHIQSMDKDYDIVVASGGDGTVNLVLNALLKNNMNIPLGIIPSGTANDFATFLGLQTANVEKSCNAIITTKPEKIDIGVVNGEYFINVCAGGLLTNVSQNIDINFKNALGNLAYYIKGIEQIPNFSSIPFRITNSSKVIEEELYLFAVLNTTGAGSFDKLAPKALINDGMFDFIGIKARPVYELAVLFLKILRGEHINDTNIVYFQDNYIKIECLLDSLKYAESNVDGEAGPYMPLEIKLLEKQISVYGIQRKK